VTAPATFSELLAASERGDPEASKRLMALVYDELRALASSYARNQPANHTLQPTAVVHEALAKLLESGADRWESRAHFFAVAARAMRQVLTDHARAKRTQKRGGDALERVTLDTDRVAQAPLDVDVIALDDALSELAGYDERKHRVVELRYFGGLTIEETASVLGVSTTTVESEWRAARAWLAQRLKG
jgi:RNA polymerase sigma factor (TIGR02999 family)